MKILIPQNIFSALMSFAVDDEVKSQFDIKPSSAITSEIVAGNADAGFIPTMDLLTNKDLFISKDLGYSFDDKLSNSFLYFLNDAGYGLDELFLRGDLSSNDIILSKILFKEKYDVDIKSTIDTNDLDLGFRNYLIAGNENIEAKGFINGISFSDEISDLIDAPYVNFILAAKDEATVKKVSESIKDIDSWLEDNIDKTLVNIDVDQTYLSYISDNLNSLYFDLTNVELKSLNELVKMTYYFGIVDDIFDLKFC